MIKVNNNCGLIICILILVSVFSIILFLNWYATYQTNKEVARWGARVEKCKIDRYEKIYGVRKMGNKRQIKQWRPNCDGM